MATRPGARSSSPGDVLSLTHAQFELDNCDSKEVSDALYGRLRERAIAKSESSSMPAEVMEAITACQAAANEYLRLFWTAVAPDAAGNARMTTGQRTAKASRMASYLSRTPERVELVVSDAVALGVARERVEAALAPVGAAVRAALAIAPA